MQNWCWINQTNKQGQKVDVVELENFKERSRVRV
jgi:hypothetical protein